MRLENARGEYLQMKIVDYQFPENADDKWDSNWLNIEYEINHSSKGNWTVITACMLTYEVERLWRWFEILSTDHLLVNPVLHFVEPIIMFSLIYHSRRGPDINVTFSNKLHPDWIPPKDRNGDWDFEEISIDFPVDEINLQHPIQSLRSQLRKYPERARQP